MIRPILNAEETIKGSKILVNQKPYFLYIEENGKRKKTETVAGYSIITRHSKLAGVHRIKTHALRHSHVSLLISLGENALVIRDRLGHEDIKTTLETYGHLYPNMNRGVANKLNNILKFDNKSAVEQRTKVSNQFMNARKYKNGIIEDEQ